MGLGGLGMWGGSDGARGLGWGGTGMGRRGLGMWGAAMGHRGLHRSGSWAKGKNRLFRLPFSFVNKMYQTHSHMPIPSYFTIIIAFYTRN